MPQVVFKLGLAVGVALGAASCATVPPPPSEHYVRHVDPPRVKSQRCNYEYTEDRQVFNRSRNTIQAAARDWQAHCDHVRHYESMGYASPSDNAACGLFWTTNLINYDNFDSQLPEFQAALIPVVRDILSVCIPNAAFVGGLVLGSWVLFYEQPDHVGDTPSAAELAPLQLPTRYLQATPQTPLAPLAGR